jgi:hypothetical protein
MIVLALAIALFAEKSSGQQAALPKSAKLTRDANGVVTGVRIAGESDRDRLVVTPKAIQTLAKSKN